MGNKIAALVAKMKEQKAIVMSLLVVVSRVILGNSLVSY
jgi:hypothetical protein